MYDKYAQVILAVTHSKVDRIFDYGIPKEWENTICVGGRVIVPFGQKNSRTEGYVVGILEQTNVPKSKIKAILDVLDEGKPVFTPVTLALAKLMKQKYFCTLNQCLQAIMPTGIRTKNIWYVQLQPVLTVELTEQEKEIVTYLEQKGKNMPIQDLENAFGSRYQYAIQTLKEKGILKFRQKTLQSKYKKEKRYVTLTDDTMLLSQAMEKAQKEKRLLGQRKILTLLQEVKKISVEDLKEKTGVTQSPIQTLLQKGVLIEEREQQKRDVFRLEDFKPSKPFTPTTEQKQALEQMLTERKKEKKRPVVLHGVTGSGKTELYMQLVQEVLTEGKQAIVLVPEISLTPQIMERFISRFGDVVSVTHSRLSVGERLDQWRKARDGEISVMIGARSALFLPFQNVGVIIMDEAHESSYYSDTTPKYNARDVAKDLADLTGALLVMGSATPDLESYHKAIMGEFLLVELKQRAKGNVLPHTTIVDMRKELEEGNRSPFSRVLQEAIKQNLLQKRQTMLFLNRRGYATFVSCRKCGEAMTCPDCNITYTYHAKENILLCHYCGRQEKVPEHCPVCGSSYIRYFGTGTQKIEEETKKLFPEARVLRMDLDTTSQKNSHAHILEMFGKGDADILIGTQMIAKGHDFPNVTLVGILAADLSLHANNYTAAENCFQLVTQAAGRAGRDRLPGEVYIQTYQPKHPAIKTAAAQDYEGFYSQEILLRRAMEYPPFTHLFSVLITGEKEHDVIEAAQNLWGIMEYFKERADCTVLAPSPASLPKFRGEYRWRVLVKCKDVERLQSFVLYTVEKTKKKTNKNVYFHLALQPQNIV